METNGFERSIPTEKLGSPNAKDSIEKGESKTIMDKLKSTHFILGKDTNAFDYKASTKIGKYAQTARN